MFLFRRSPLGPSIISMLPIGTALFFEEETMSAWARNGSPVSGVPIYNLGKLKHRASKSKGLLVKIYNISLVIYKANKRRRIDHLLLFYFLSSMLFTFILLALFHLNADAFSQLRQAAPRFITWCFYLVKCHQGLADESVLS